MSTAYYRDICIYLLENGLNREQIIGLNHLISANWDFSEAQQILRDELSLRAFRDDDDIFATKKTFAKIDNLTIFSRNCAGGLLYKSMGSQFLSPTINMFFDENEFIDFLGNPKEFLNKDLKLIEKGFEINLKIYYPIFDINGISVNMNHYDSVDVAVTKWQERTKRINWDNILALMYTDNLGTLRRFEKLPYKKKICFVPFESDSNAAFCFDQSQVEETSLGYVANAICRGKYPLYYNRLIERIK